MSADQIVLTRQDVRIVASIATALPFIFLAGCVAYLFGLKTGKEKMIVSGRFELTADGPGKALLIDREAREYWVCHRLESTAK